MTSRILLAAGALLLASTAAQAQVAPTNFDQAAYITCKEAHAMTPEPRKMLAIYLADHAARLSRRGDPRRRAGRPARPSWCAAAAPWRPTPTCSR